MSMAIRRTSARVTDRSVGTTFLAWACFSGGCGVLAWIIQRPWLSRTVLITTPLIPRGGKSRFLRRPHDPLGILGCRRKNAVAHAYQHTVAAGGSGQSVTGT